MAEQNRFSCTSCGKQYPWKVELAGRRAKCAKCGTVITVPAAPGGDDEGLYDLAPDEPQRAAPVAARPEAVTDLPPAAVAPNLPPASPAPTMAYPGAPVMRKPVIEEPDRKSQVLKILIPLFAIVALVVLFVAGRYLFTKSDTKKNALAGDDARVAEMRESGGMTEAREWLQDTQRILFGYATHQARGRVDQLYAKGAKQVACFGPRLSNFLGVELPDDPAQRQALFDDANRWHESEIASGKVEKAVEKKQKWLLLRMRAVVN